MVQKIRKIVIAAVLSIAVFGMSFSALSASAAVGNDDGCQHTTKIYQGTVISYPNADNLTHKKRTDEIWVCDDCGVKFHDIRDVIENHKPVSGTAYCECGYRLY